MVGSPPPRFQFATVPSVWSRLLPISKNGLTQKLLGSKSARAARLLAIINSAVRQNTRTRTFIIGFLSFYWWYSVRRRFPNGFAQGATRKVRADSIPASQLFCRQT